MPNPNLAERLGKAEGSDLHIDKIETIWLSQKLMAALFAMDVRTVSEHLKNIFASGELDEDSVIRKFRITESCGKSYATNHYNRGAPTTKAFFAKAQNRLH